MPPPSSVADQITPPDEVTSQAVSGFLTGAARFGSLSLLAHIALQRVYPHRTYVSLTPQFKVFVQLSAMMLGGCIWAEKRVTEYNDMARKRRRAMDRSERAWAWREQEEEWNRREREKVRRMQEKEFGQEQKG